MSTETTNVVSADAPEATTVVESKRSGRPMSETTKFVFNLLEQNPALTFAEAQPSLTAANIELDESGFKVRKHQFENRNGTTDSNREARRSQREELNAAIKLAIKGNRNPSCQEVLDSLTQQGFTITYQNLYQKIRSIKESRSRTPTKKAAKVSTTKRKVGRPSKTKATKATKVTRTRSTKASVTTPTTTLSLDNAIKLIQKAGGLKAAQARLNEQEAAIAQQSAKLADSRAAIAAVVQAQQLLNASK